ncbi:hypothetical protein [Streptomyces platensis]|uniref:hypothetical protein n=1 Tax=Streptomyces platensis TaxID=58346 RepID=UPI0036C01FB2
MTRKKAWAIGAVAFAAGAATALSVASPWDHQPQVTVSSKTAAQSIPQTREGLITAWTAELDKAGKTKPDGWELLTTGEIRGRYIHQQTANTPKADDIDPGFAGPQPGDVWTTGPAQTLAAAVGAVLTGGAVVWAARRRKTDTAAQ